MYIIMNIGRKSQKQFSMFGKLNIETLTVAQNNQSNSQFKLFLGGDTKIIETSETEEKKESEVAGEKKEKNPSRTYILSETAKNYITPESYDIVAETINVNNRPIETNSHNKSYNPTLDPYPEEKNGSEEVNVITLENTFGSKKGGMKGEESDKEDDEIYILGKEKNKKGKYGTFSKIDAYNPKYLEMLDKNINRNALVFKNLDLYSDNEIDKIFLELGNQRIKDLMKMAPGLLGVVLDCTPIVEPQIKGTGHVIDKPGASCRRYITPLYKESDRIRLLRKLEPRMRKPKQLSRARHEIVVNNLHIIEDDLITKEEYEIAEGAKIMSWVENNLIFYGGYNTKFFEQMMFSDLLMHQMKGHIYFARAGIRKPSLVTPDLIELSYLQNQYNNPINIANLIMQMQTPSTHTTERIPGTQTSIGEMLDSTKEEASKIMALEYYICLQPEPRYMLYILKRLIIAWYADFDLNDAITKIRLLINQYRARRDKKENLKWGVLPSILIYLRYGSIMFNKALSKINYYFTTIIHTGWIGNEPDYFTKYNDLIYYTNGSPDAKRFFEHLPIAKKMEIYKPFTINPTAFFKYGVDIVNPYPQKYTKKYGLEYRSKFDLKRNEWEGEPNLATAEINKYKEVEDYIRKLEEEKV